MLRHLFIGAQTQYCFFPIRSPFTFYFSIAMMIANCILLIYAWFRYHKIEKLSLKFYVKFTFFLIVVESTFFIISFIINDVYYMTEIEPNIYNQKSLETFSVINDLFFVAGGFVVQWLFLLVTYNIVKNTLDYFSQRGTIYPDSVMSIYFFLKYYLKVRWVRMIPVIILLFWELQCTIMIVWTAYVSLVMNCADALISFIIMMLCYWHIMRPYLIEQKISQNNEEQAKASQMINFNFQYIGLLITAFGRFLSITIFLIDATLDLDPDCPDECVLNLILIFIGEPLLKIIPIFFMIKLQLPTTEINPGQGLREVNLHHLQQTERDSSV